MTTKIRFDTAAYVRSHGKQPKGWGGWAFEFQPDGQVHFYSSCSYTEAKRRATVDAKVMGVEVVHVGP